MGSAMSTTVNPPSEPTFATSRQVLRSKRTHAITLVVMMLGASLAALEFAAWEAAATSDADGDGLTLGLEFLLNTQPQDWDSDNDGLPDGWEWQYGLDPLDASTLGNDGASGDPDGDGLSNLQEYTYLEPTNWDLTNTANTLDNGVWWNGTVPTRNWDEESAMQANQGQGTDGTDEDPMGNICADGMDNDKDGAVDAADSDGDGDADCNSDDDDGDGLIDEDPDGWDTDNDGMSDGWEVANGLNATNPNNADGPNGDPDGDGLINLYEYMNPSWTTSSGGVDFFQPGPSGVTRTETVSPCNPVLGIGPNGCATLTAEVDGVMQTDPMSADTDGDGLNDSYEALTLLTDPTSMDTDSDGINDGVEVNGQYGNPAQASDPRNNNTDGDQLDDNEEDKNGNGQIDANETDPTRREDSGDFDNDGIENWEENLTCTRWDLFDTDFGGVGDGDERNFTHNTDPCMSTIDFQAGAVSYSSTQQRLTLNSTFGFNTNGGTGFYNDSAGTLTSFAYSAVQGNILMGVALAPPAGTVEVISKNGSWCHAQAVATGTLATTMQFCDDDFTDTDGDGLADWQELMGTFGFTSLPTDADSDDDGVNDFDEVMNGTNPMEPCDNNLDSDGDLLNDYFENNTGCPLDFIPGMVGNGTMDTYVTDYLNGDTDAGGVWDSQEYLDGTNPQNDPSDDQNPVDTDGDGIPDTVENNTGTDWRDPDTDGGGMLDGEECPPAMWPFGCIGGQFNPWDPTDDIIQNEVVFFANNTTFGVDTDLPRYWRVHTFDDYTGASFGKNSTFQIWTEMAPGHAETNWIANSSFINSTETWMMTMINPVIDSNAPMPHATTGWLSWDDSLAGLNHSNFTGDIRVSDSSYVFGMVQAPEVFHEDAELTNSIAFTGGSGYATQMPAIFFDTSHPMSQSLNITNAVVTEAGATSAWDQVLAVQDFLQNGNATTTFLRNYDGSALPMGEDMVNHMLTAAFEGTCSEFSTTATAMLRFLGIPARKVTGYAGGAWHGSGYTVTGAQSASWVEVHLQTNPAGGNLDMGWIPFDPCPAASDIEIVNETWTPMTVDRDHTTGDIWLNGTMQFVDNGTAADNISVRSFLVPPSELANPVLAANSGRLLGTGMTDENGSFSVKGVPAEIIEPGFGAIVLERSQSGYVSYSVTSFTWTINVTEDAIIIQDGPMPIGAPIVGAGAETILTGSMQWENVPSLDPSNVDNLTLFLNYTSSVDGTVSLTTLVQQDGYYEFAVNLDENEALGMLNATIEFPGWHADGEHLLTPPVYHARPASLALQFNVSPAPDLTATFESVDANSSLVIVDDDTFINGTILSRGLNPAPMNGTLYLQMRQNGSGGPMENITSWTMNSSNLHPTTGAFSIQWLASTSALASIGPGYIDVELLFVPDDLDATDVANLSAGYGLKSYIVWDITEASVPRGQQTTTWINTLDHTQGFSLDMNGTYTAEFEGQVVNTTTDPSGGGYVFDWTPDANLPAGDFILYVNYTSTSPWYFSSGSTTLIRVMGTVSVTATLSSDWTHIGDNVTLTGEIRDDLHNTFVLDNASSIAFEFELPGVGPGGPMGEPPAPVLIPVGSTMLNTSTGTFSFTMQMPTNLPAGIWTLNMAPDFSIGASPPGAYYTFDTPGAVQMGTQSESVLILDQPNMTESFTVVQAGTPLDLAVGIKDIAAYFSQPPMGQEDAQNISGADVEFFLDDGTTNVSIGTFSSGADGIVAGTWNVPLEQTPGYYDLWAVHANDTSDTLSTNNGARYIGNSTMINLTVQVPAEVVLDPWVPSTVTAGTSFQVSGTVGDSINNTRVFDGPVDIEIFWLDDANEKMAEGHTTAVNGSFNLSVATDPNNDGIVSGNHTLIVSVMNNSNPFYLTATGSKDILVMGVSDFESMTPTVGMVVNRGETVDFGGNLVEVTDNFRAINSSTVAAQFHDTWVGENTTDVNGSVGFSYTIPNTHPLGAISIKMVYNGSWHILPDVSPINTVTVRTITVLVVDPVTANPIAGDSFNVTGTLVSDNGSGIINRDGTGMLPSLTFEIDGYSTTFSVAGGVAQADGTWAATLTLDQNFPRGNHTVTAIYTPTVNFYEGSSANNTFDSRGYSVLQITSPEDLGMDDRVVRGDGFNVSIRLIDNAQDPLANQTVTVALEGLGVSADVVTDANGLATVMLTVPDTTAPGPLNVTADYSGMPGTTGVLGDATAVRVVVLAPSVVTVTSAEGTFIAGEDIWINGTLLDEHGAALIHSATGENASGLLHLEIDNVDVGDGWMVMTNATTGAFSLHYVLPTGITAGAHTAEVRFLGGYLWVDPVGQGDSANPEYYLPSSAVFDFNASQPTHIVISQGGGEIDRDDLLAVGGTLLDLVDRPVVNETIEVWLDGVFLTNVTTDANGDFVAYYPVPSDMTLGPVDMDVIYAGAGFHLPSETDLAWTVYTTPVITVDNLAAAAIGDTIQITGTVRDNLPDNWLDNHSVDIRVDGLLVGSAATGPDGVFVFEYTIPTSLDLGEHTIEAYAPAQSWYREAVANGTFWVAHHSAIDLSAEDGGDATRGMFWTINGRLYDVDVIGLPGIEGADVEIALDGAGVATATTDAEGRFTVTIPVEMQSARGDHVVTARYDGSADWLGSEANETVTTWADVRIEISSVASNIIRGDATHPVVIEGRIVEEGGSGNNLLDGELLLSLDGTAIPIGEVEWLENTTGGFRITFVADRWVAPGDADFLLTHSREPARHLNEANTTVSAFIRIQVTVALEVEEVRWGGRDISGVITVRDLHSGAVVTNVSMSVHLQNSTTDDPLNLTQSRDTDENGQFAFEYNSPEPLPAFSDQGHWGELHLKLSSGAPAIAADSLAEFSAGSTYLSYEPAPSESDGLSTWAWLLIAVLIAAAAAGLILYRQRKQDALSELADVFEYTAELLAAGDEIREAIFICYEQLCSTLMSRGFLRRDFETVREFEVAIRKAMPLSEEALTGLDNMFEIARYSRAELGEAHKQQAQNALSRVLGEIQNVQDIPQR